MYQQPIKVVNKPVMNPKRQTGISSILNRNVGLRSGSVSNRNIGVKSNKH
jgi:hypothetical protein